MNWQEIYKQIRRNIFFSFSCLLVVLLMITSLYGFYYRFFSLTITNKPLDYHLLDKEYEFLSDFYVEDDQRPMTNKEKKEEELLRKAVVEEQKSFYFFVKFFSILLVAFILLIVGSQLGIYFFYKYKNRFYSPIKKGCLFALIDEKDYILKRISSYSRERTNRIPILLFNSKDNKVIEPPEEKYVEIDDFFAFLVDQNVVKCSFFQDSNKILVTANLLDSLLKYFIVNLDVLGGNPDKEGIECLFNDIIKNFLFYLENKKEYIICEPSIPQLENMQRNFSFRYLKNQNFKNKHFVITEENKIFMNNFFKKN